MVSEASGVTRLSNTDAANILRPFATQWPLRHKDTVLRNFLTTALCGTFQSQFVPHRERNLHNAGKSVNAVKENGPSQSREPHKHIHTPCGQNLTFYNVPADGTHSYHYRESTGATENYGHSRWTPVYITTASPSVGPLSALHRHI